MKSIKRFAWGVALATLLLPVAVSAETAVKILPKQKVDVVFVLDTTGSMGGLIDGAKRKIWSIANTIVDDNPDAEIRVGLVGYRDIGDEYVTRSFELTTDIQGIYGKLLAFQADGGGDTPESVNEALDAAVTKQGWAVPQSGQQVSKIIFLVGDAPPHMDYKQDRKYPEVIKEARQKGIIVNAVQAGGMRETRKVWQEIAKLGAGEYIPIPQDGGRIVIIETPYDDEIIVIQKELNGTVIPYGAAERQSAVRGKMESYEKAPKSSAADMAKYVNKSGKGKEVVTGAGDLIADIDNGSRKLSDVKAAELPANMQKMTDEEKTAYVTEMTKKRDDLAQKLAEKVSQRDEFIKTEEMKKGAEAAAPADSFDRAVSKTLKEQLK